MEAIVDIRKIVRSDPGILGGVPAFVGTRVPVKTLYEYLEAGDSLDEFLDDFRRLPASRPSPRSSWAGDDRGACGCCLTNAWPRKFKQELPVAAVSVCFQRKRRYLFRRNVRSPKSLPLCICTFRKC